MPNYWVLKLAPIKSDYPVQSYTGIYSTVHDTYLQLQSMGAIVHID